MNLIFVQNSISPTVLHYIEYLIYPLERIASVVILTSLITSGRIDEYLIHIHSSLPNQVTLVGGLFEKIKWRTIEQKYVILRL